MRFYSTNNPDRLVSLREVVLEGLPPDNGLYMPEEIAPLPQAFLWDIERYSFQEIGYEVARNLLRDSLPDHIIYMLVEKALTFDAPLKPLREREGVLELFHGPTLAFKDFGARFMAQLMAYLVRDETRPLTILVATSGDTGGAVASGFYRTPGIEVVILYPSGKVSDLQEKQLTTLGHNITALEIAGSFDDCQALVKQAFLDQSLKKRLRLSSANSINLARLIPQSFYYFRAWQQVQDRSLPLVFSVPSGNFGNLTAGIMAKRMGLPVARFLAATNANRVVPDYLQTGVFHPKTSVPTISNAMDVGNPSNFARMLDLYGHSHEAMQKEIAGFSYTDTQTCDAIKDIYDETGYIMDPHGAVGWLALQDYRATAGEACTGIVLETAHPAKFLSVVQPLLGVEVEVPERLARLAEKEKHAIVMKADYTTFQEYLMSRT
ncbi:MAG: threonine synthase [Bacteroidetes bacterium]|nr:MAG: threonine synthase [Bacteroidota bacterium]